MNVSYDVSLMSGAIFVTRHPNSRTIELSRDAIATVDPDDKVLHLELLDTRPFGEVFDEHAAERALTWARVMLSPRTRAERYHPRT